MSAAPSERAHGREGPHVVVLHGGPGAPGSAASLCAALADGFRVLEALQRGSGDAPLTVARHVADLHALVVARGLGRPAIVGHSWGAMLALAFAAAHPDHAGPLALVGCGTFDVAARARLQARCEARIDAALRARLAELARTVVDPDERLARAGELLAPAYAHDLADAPGGDRCDARAHDETWADMLRLQREGRYPAAFAAVRGPVAMFHGAEDPHPGPLIRDGLRAFIPHLEYHEWPTCGHYPWLERTVGAAVVRDLRAWLREALVR